MNTFLKAARIAATLSAVLMSSGIAALSAAPAQAAPSAPQIDRPASVLLVDSRDQRRTAARLFGLDHGRDRDHRDRDHRRWQGHDNHNRNWGRHDQHHNNSNNDWRRPQRHH